MGLFWAAYLLILVAAAWLKPIAPPFAEQAVWGAASAAALVGLTWLFVVREGRSLREIGFALEAASGVRFATGALAGLAVYGVNVVVVWVLAGPLVLTPVPGDRTGPLLVALATFFATSAMEELGFRGYPLRTLTPSLGVWRAQALVALAFGLAHIAYGWPWTTVLLGVLPHAVLFGVAALVSRGLAFPIGLHAGINVARWSVGETAQPGLWTMDASDAAKGTISAVAPVVGIVIPLLLAFAMWRVHAGRAGRAELDGSL